MTEAEATPDKRKRRRWAVWAAAVLLLIGGGYLLSQRTSKSGSATSNSTSTTSSKGGGGRRGASGPIPVSVTKVQTGNIGDYINALGTVTPVYTDTVASRVPGELLDVRYKEGQIVHKGELLAQIDPRPYEATVIQAQGQLARDQAALKNALLDLNRYKTAYVQHAIPEQTVATQQAAVEQDQGTVRFDEGTLKAAQVNLDYATITAPINGRVGLRTVDPGNLIQANTTTIVTITQMQPITVIFTMAEDNIDQVAPQLRAGKKLQVQALDRTDEHVISTGTLLTLDNQIDVTTGTVKARATFANAHYELFPNEFVNASLLVKRLMGVNLIPTAAIQRNSDVAFVYVVDPQTSTVHSTNIQVATINGTTAAVTGVAPGQTLVTDGFDRLVEGGKVAIRGEGPNAGATGPGEANSESAPAQTQRTGQPNQAQSGRAQKGAANTQINTHAAATQSTSTVHNRNHAKGSTK